jgi:aryl-phospho-beta-D-glucosidase BglC (GH1 family)
MKSTTIIRFNEWAKTHSDTDVFNAGVDSWTKKDFAVAFLGETPKKTANPINIDVKEELNADLEGRLETGHIEESGD